MFQSKEVCLQQLPYPKSAIVYSHSFRKPHAVLLYFHGGGLLYGDKRDLPDCHIRRLTEAGYSIISFDYPLAPAAKLPLILEDVCASIRHYLEHPLSYVCRPLPYLLWGRSAGAYLCLSAAACGQLPSPPSGILSYYGYGFLCDNWFQSPSSFYRTFPPVSADCLQAIPKELHPTGSLQTHYSVYVYARQQGCWKDLIYEGREKFFFLQHSLRTCDRLPCPLFCAHSTGDTDVPYEEFLALRTKYNAFSYVAPCSDHDFDRDPSSAFTAALLDASLAFLDQIFGV